MAIQHHKRMAALAVGAVLTLPFALVAAAPAASSTVAADHQYLGEITANPSLNVRGAPTTHAGTKYSLSKGSTIFIKCKAPGPTVDGNSRWYKLTDGGWATARYIANIGEAPSWCGSDETYEGKVVSNTSLNVRQGPSSAEAKVGSIARGDHVMVGCKVTSQRVDGNNRWYLVVSDGDEGWVTARYVDNVSTIPRYC